MTKSELMERLSELTEEEVAEVLDFIKLLRTTPEELTEEEMQEVNAGREEFARGEWVNLEDMRRRDV